MDELLQDFLIESGEHIDAVAAQLVEFERQPSNQDAISNIYRLVHTIKGTCGFLELPRLERLAHAAETLIGRVRRGGEASQDCVSAVLEAVDRIRTLLHHIEKFAREPEGSDIALIAKLNRLAETSAPGDGAHEPDEEAHAAARVMIARETSRQRAMQAPEGPALEASVRKAGDSGERRDQALLERSGIRVSVDALERIMRLVSELVLTRNQLLDVARGESNSRFNAPLQRLSSLTTDLQDGVMRARMQPIERVYSKLPRLVRDLAVELGKKIDLVLDGSDTELDRQLIEVLRDPLTHLIRNCADHGVEAPDERVAAGKPQAGRIHVRASHEAGFLVVEVTDDGRGLDLARIRAKALAVGVASADDLEAMSDHALSRLIFEPGFSTAASVSNVSGRGIGLDVVLNRIESVGGSVEVASHEGGGARFTIKLPLTLAIAPALVVWCAGQRFALPQQAVIEALSVLNGGVSRIDNVGGSLVADLRGSIVPIVDLRTALRLPPASHQERAEGLIVVLRTGGNTYGLLVDSVADFQEIVVKPLGRTLADLAVYTGNTILGDGSVVLILDPSGVARVSGIKAKDRSAAETEARQSAPVREPTALLLFRVDGAGLKALPLSLVSRIVTAARGDLVENDGRLSLLRDKALIPLVALCDPAASGRRDWPVLIAGVGGEAMGLLVSELVDVVTQHVDIEIAGVTSASVGSFLVRGEPAELLDIAHYLQSARPAAFKRGHTSRFAVLLVDDKAFFRDMLAPVLSAGGYDTTLASSGAEALALLRKGARFDALVTDLE
ncbi:MAG: ATPase, partial [Hyphomicrobiales bacterium]|nr:ATPase [Hyphomicrobiales bacterium]